MKYRKEILVSTAPYENMRFGVEVELSDFDPVHSIHSATPYSKFEQLKTLANDMLVSEIVEAELGEKTARRDAVEAKVRKKYRL